MKNQRQRRDEKQRVSHFTEGVGTKIEVKDAEDVQRSIILGEEGAKPTNFEGYTLEKDKVKDHFGNTAQYIKFVNASIQEKHKRIQSIHDKHKQFEDEIDSLRFDQPRPKERLDQIKYREIKALDIIDTLQHLEKEREEIQYKKEHLEKQCNKSEEELILKNKQIAEVKAELEFWRKKEIEKEKKQDIENDPVNQIQHKIRILAEKKHRGDIVKVLDNLVNQLGLKETDIQEAIKSNSTAKI